MTPAEALAQADRHCDIEGLPQASAAARALDGELIAGRIQPGEAVRELVRLHSVDLPPDPPLSR